MTTQQITSRSNPRLKAVRRLLKAGFDASAIVVEGEKLVREALAAGWNPESLWCTQPVSLPVGCETFQLPQSVYAAISPTKSGRSPLAVFPVPSFREIPEHEGLDGASLLLDQIQDPGNAGALVRAALAFGFTRVLWHQPTVYPYNHACIRASAGAVFHLKHHIIQADWLEKNEVQLVAGDIRGTSLTRFTWPPNPILALGNEGHGFSEVVVQKLCHRVRIPIHPNSESLNVAGAGHILMYHYRSMTNDSD